LRALCFAWAVAGLTLCAAASANTEARFVANADTTIYAEQGGGTSYDATSDGSGPNLWTSVIVAGVTRRSLIRFDLTALPAGSRVLSAQLQMFEVRGRDAHDLSVHRVLAAWGEAGSNGGDAGVGAPAQAGDATWSHRFWPTQTWTQRGGDFVASPSSTLWVGPGPGAFVWPSTPQSVADVQAWVDQPSSNHGWILIGDDTGEQNAKRFGSRNNATVDARPVLIVRYDKATPPDDGDVPLPGWALALLGAGLAAAMLRRRR
jgi:MYXO-CTERM domain-containing protein